NGPIVNQPHADERRYDPAVPPTDRQLQSPFRDPELMPEVLEGRLFFQGPEAQLPQDPAPEGRPFGFRSGQPQTSESRRLAPGPATRGWEGFGATEVGKSELYFGHDSRGPTAEPLVSL